MHIPHINFTSEIFTKYPEIFAMILGNTRGKLWLMGGSLVEVILDVMSNPSRVSTIDYRNFTTDGEFPYRDLDILVEKMLPHMVLASGWEKRVSTFGGVKLVKKSHLREEPISIDMWEISKHEPCIRNNRPRTIEQVLDLVPFTTQCLAYDAMEARLLGEAGKRAVLTKTVAVHNMNEAENFCRVYKTDIRSALKKIANKYNFTPIFP